MTNHIGQRNHLRRHLPPLAFALDRQRHFAFRTVADPLGALNETFRRFAIHLHDHIAFLQASFFGRTCRLDPGDRQRVGTGFYACAEPDGLGDFRNKNFRDRLGDQFDRNGEPDAVPLAIDRHVQSDEFTAQIDQRPAAAAGVDGRVGLQPVGHVQRLVLQ